MEEPKEKVPAVPEEEKRDQGEAPYAKESIEEKNGEREVTLSIQDLELWFKEDYAKPKILNKVSFDVYKGETLGIAGESGCGKSVTSLSILRLLKGNAEHAGEIDFHGENLLKVPFKRMRQIRGNKITMIFQEPMTSLNPLLKVGFQISEVLRLHQGMTRRQAKEKAIEMLRAVNVASPERRVKEYPHQLSGGMRQRVMIAMCLACNPELLIADEPTTALDVTIQAQVLKLMRELQERLGTAILFITHDLGVIREMCERVIVMYCGEIMEEAPTKELFGKPTHPYTIGLLGTLPKYGEEGELPTIPGMVPPSGKFPAGCVFSPRCPYACEKCVSNKPEITEIEPGHKVRCFRAEEIFSGKIRPEGKNVETEARS